MTLRTFPALVPRPLKLAPLKLAMTGWAVFFAYLVVQCLAHQAFVARVAVDAWDSVAWTIREWGIWLLLTPVLLWSVERLLRSRERLLPAIACIACLAAALVFRVSLDSDSQAPMGSLVYFLPKYLGAWLLVLAVGVWLLTPRSAAAEPVDATPRTLQVYAGRDLCLLDVGHIDAFSAAKNYVDVRSGGRTYLVRSTLKEIEDGLPRGEFIRTHRSHLVRVGAIDRVRLLPTGTGLVVLRDGSTVAVSRKYYREFARSGSPSG